MTESGSDLDILMGPDRRKFPRPSWQAGIVIVIAFLVAIGLIILVPKVPLALDLSALGFADDNLSATVTQSESGPCSYDDALPCLTVEFEFIYQDEVTIYTQEFSQEIEHPELQIGDSVFISVTQHEDGSVSFQYSDRDRRLLIAAVLLIFAAAVIALGRWRGVYALFGLAASVVVLLLFIVPAIIAGRDAVLVALVGGGAIALISLYVTHGPNPLTHVSALGAFGALALTTFLSWLVLEFAQFTGLADEESFYLAILPDLDLSGLLLAGIVLGTIGALDDVTVTQASAVWEVSTANPELDSNHLFAAGLRVGRDHIASTVNTLLLAYAGAALPLLILFSLSGQVLGFVASTEVIAVEIVRTLVGSIGLIAAVPLTTFLASRAVVGIERTPPTSPNHESPA